MTHNRRNAAKLTLRIFCFASILFLGGNLHAQNAANGEALYKANCTSCHAMDKVLTGPALEGAVKRWKDPKLLHTWIKHNPAAVATHDAYIVNLVNQFKSP